jgi:hypothetical protein
MVSPFNNNNENLQKLQYRIVMKAKLVHPNGSPESPTSNDSVVTHLSLRTHLL